MMSEMAKAYDPKSFEARWYERWEKEGVFSPREDAGPETFTIVIPPPNITGALTIGHVLNNTIQDALIRWNRMRGKKTLWLPGTDHAGIATQNVVKKDLDARGMTMEQLGRERFVEEAWKWRETYGGKIIRQLRLLGASCDWSRERFTLDPGLSDAVGQVFARLYKKGLIYRGEYLVNWCIGCQTAISDEEVEYVSRDDHLYYVKYPIKGLERSVTVATTRPETMLGDTAVAVHPDDPRYADLHGKILVLPILDREIPVITDAIVEREFGTGAVKVTPGHDPNDFEMGRRHELAVISVIDWLGQMTSEAGPFAGEDRLVCRKRIVENLKKNGLLERVEPYTHSVGTCHRCNTVVEPSVSTQWFVKMKPLAQPAIEAVKQGKIRFLPQRWEKVYLHWLENIRDWCISRQLWWGHRIPVWYNEEGEVCLTGESPAFGRNKKPRKGWRQDEDVLDTWFSSWLWPFSTLGWPEETEDLATYYPTDVLVTGPDIIFFWVARMVMAGCEFMGQEPFHTVHFHGMIRDEQGRKMSKSLGNSPDPITLIEKYGADALRFTMLRLTPVGTDVLFSEKKIELGRNFANKIWNAARFALMNLRDAEIPKPEIGTETLPDRWLASRLCRVCREVDEEFREMRFNEISRELYAFVWNDYCDWYLEMAKVRIAAGGTDAQKARSGILAGLDAILRLLHPLMPFLTEEIASYLPLKRGMMIVSEWPSATDYREDADAEAQFDLFRQIVTAIRNLRSEMNVPPGREADVTVRAGGAVARVAREQESSVKSLARVGELRIGRDHGKPRHAASAVVADAEVFVHLEGLIDLEVERKRLIKELEKTEKLLTSAHRKLSNQDFLEKAKPHVIEAEQEKLSSLEASLEKLRTALAAVDD
jgi:valyl-tRNA synthetase